VAAGADGGWGGGGSGDSGGDGWSSDGWSADGGSDPEDFEGMAEDLQLSRFTGRARLIGQIEEFIERSGRDRGYVLVLGGAGVGKTALAAHLVKEWRSTKEWDCVHHFTRLGGGTPRQACLALATQLARLHPSLRERFRRPDAFISDEAASDWLRKVVVAAAAARRTADGPDAAPGGTPGEAKPRPLVLVIDGLDEAERAPNRNVSMPLGLPRPRDLPRGVFVVATSRDGPPLLALDAPSVRTVRLGGAGGAADTPDDGHLENMRDARAYLTAVTEGSEADAELVVALRDRGMSPLTFTETLLAHSEGVWIYLRYALDDVRAGADPAQVLARPGGLEEYYLREVERWMARDAEAWRRGRFPALARLAALRRPVTASELAALAGTDRDSLVPWLDQDLRPFLLPPDFLAGPNGERRYAIRHQSLRDLFAAPAGAGHLDGGRADEWRHALREAHGVIARHLTPPGPPGERDWSGADEYTRTTLVEHAAAAGSLDDLVGDPGFLLCCEPSALLRRRGDLVTPGGRAAADAYEEAVSKWSVCPFEERAWWLHVWARKTGAAALAAASVKIIHQDPVILAAMWTGTTHSTLVGHDGAVHAVAAVPLDGRTVLASAGSDGTTRLWDPATGGPAGEPLLGHEGGVRAVAAVRLDGRTVLATGSADGTARLWDPATGEPIGGPLAGHRGAVNGVAAVPSPDGLTLLATVGDDATVRLWDAATGRPVGAPLRGHGDRVRAVAALPRPDGTTLLATGGADGVARLWDPGSGEQVRGIPAGHPGPVNGVAAVSPRGGSVLLATAGGDGVVRLFDPGTGEEIRSIAACANRPVLALAPVGLPGGRAGVATAAGDGTVRLWDVASGDPAGDPLAAGANWVNAVTEVSSPDERTLLAAGGSNGTVHLWDISIEPRAAAPSTGHQGSVLAAAAMSVRGRGTVIATAGDDGTVRLWDAVTGRSVGSPLTGHTGSVRAVAPVPLRDGRVWIATGGDDRTVRLWDPLEGRPARRPLIGHTRSVRAVATIPVGDGAVALLSGSGDGTVRLWDPLTGRPMGDPLVNQTGRVRAVAAVPLPDGHTWLAAAGDYGTVRLWDPDSRRSVGRLFIGQNDRVNGLAAVTVGGRTLLAVVGDDGMVHLWDPRSGQQVGDPLPGHGGRVNTVAAVVMTGERVGFATGGDDGTVLVWAFRTDLVSSGGPP
jgi:WD40 repeat protein